MNIQIKFVDFILTIMLNCEFGPSVIWIVDIGMLNWLFLRQYNATFLQSVKECIFLKNRSYKNKAFLKTYAFTAFNFLKRSIGSNICNARFYASFRQYTSNIHGGTRINNTEKA